MSLFTDSDHVTESDLVAVDPQITAVATADDLTVSSLIRQAWDECADELGQVMQPQYDYYVDPVLAAHTYSVVAPVQLSRIVVSSEYQGRNSPLKRWMIWMAIRAFYRAAAVRADNDRYDKKLDRAENEVAKAWRTVFSMGLPTVLSPLPCPGAVHELQAGVFGSDNVTAVAGGSGSASDYRVAITWVDNTSYVSAVNPANGESGASEAVTASVADAEVLRVSLDGLYPPGSVTIPRPVITAPYYMRTATHWNVYVGASSGPIFLQNADPIAIGTTSYTLADAPVLSGFQLGTGQVADGLYKFQRVVGRG